MKKKYSHDDFFSFKKKEIGKQQLEIELISLCDVFFKVLYDTKWRRELIYFIFGIFEEYIWTIFLKFDQGKKVVIPTRGEEEKK